MRIEWLGNHVTVRQFGKEINSFLEIKPHILNPAYMPVLFCGLSMTPVDLQTPDLLELCCIYALADAPSCTHPQMLISQSR